MRKRVGVLNPPNNLEIVSACETKSSATGFSTAPRRFLRQSEHRRTPSRYGYLFPFRVEAALLGLSDHGQQQIIASIIEFGLQTMEVR
jgi:hypothetical protein